MQPKCALHVQYTLCNTRCVSAVIFPPLLNVGGAKCASGVPDAHAEYTAHESRVPALHCHAEEFAEFFTNVSIILHFSRSALLQWHISVPEKLQIAAIHGHINFPFVMLRNALPCIDKLTDSLSCFPV